MNAVQCEECRDYIAFFVFVLFDMDFTQTSSAVD